MSYVTIIQACKDGHHDECTGHENTPIDPDVCGGGHCMCECHTGGPNWYTEGMKAMDKPLEDEVLSSPIFNQTIVIPPNIKSIMDYADTKAKAIEMHLAAEMLLRNATGLTPDQEDFLKGFLMPDFPDADG